MAAVLALVYRYVCVWENKRRDKLGNEAFDHAYEDDLTDMKVSAHRAIQPRYLTHRYCRTHSSDTSCSSVETKFLATPLLKSCRTSNSQNTMNVILPIFCFCSFVQSSSLCRAINSFRVTAVRKLSWVVRRKGLEGALITLPRRNSYYQTLIGTCAIFHLFSNVRSLASAL